ncbi:MAG: hypothetical protein KA118_07990 [Verrucomicrobia bacterium]|nr:hypothetical protein [Verrucomicrobiota bacterium]
MPKKLVDAMFQDYMAGASITELARRYQVPRKSVESRAARGHWLAKRNSPPLPATEGAVKDSAGEPGDLVQRFPVWTHSYLANGSKLIHGLLDDAAQLRPQGKVSISDWRDLVGGVSVLLGAARQHYGLDAAALQIQGNNIGIVVGDLEDICGLTSDLAEASPAAGPTPRGAGSAPAAIPTPALQGALDV